MNLRRVIVSSCCLLSVAQAEEVLREVSWGDVKAAGGFSDARMALTDDATRGDILTIRNTRDTLSTITLLVLDDPGVTASTYALRGDIRYEDVTGVTFLEMLSHFPVGTAFTRGQATSGPLRRIAGSSDGARSN